MGHTLAVATSTVIRASVGGAYCAGATCGSLRKRRKTERAEVKEENYGNEEEEWPGIGKGRRKG